MKKNYRTVTVLTMIMNKEGEIVTLCNVIIDRAKDADQNITPFLQSEIRKDNKKACSDPACLLNKGYQAWRGTAYDDYYKQVNTTQARCRQIIAVDIANNMTDAEKKAAEKKAAEKKAAEKKAAARKNITPSEKATATIGKEKMKTAAQKKRADGWNDKAKTARTALKTVQASSKKQLVTIATLEKKVIRLEKENSRLTREKAGTDKVYQELFKAMKAANTLEQFQAII